MGSYAAKTWNGSAWVRRPVKVWNGSAWVSVAARSYQGGTWSPALATGPTLPVGAVIFTDSFTGADGAAWSTTTWKNGFTRNGLHQIASNAGQLIGTASNSLVSRAYNGSNLTNFEALYRVRHVSGTGLLELVFRASGYPLDGQDTYTLGVTTTGLRLQVWNATYVATTVATAAITRAAGSWYWVRARINGSTMQARVWADGSAEPSTWGINATDTYRGSAGNTGFRVTGVATADVDDVTVAQYV